MIHPAVAVDKYQTVAFDGNRYSVPRPFAFRMVTVKGYVDRVVIVARGPGRRRARAVARRSRRWSSTRSTTWRRWTASPARWTTRRSSATGSCPACFAAFRAALERQHGAAAGARRFARVLQLLGEHPLTRVSQADRGLPARAPRSVPRPSIQRTRSLAAIEAATRRRCTDDAPTSSAAAPGPRAAARPEPVRPAPGRLRRRRARSVCSSPDRAHPARLLCKSERTLPMADVTIELLKAHFRQLRLPTMGREFERLARDAAATNQTFAQFLLRLTEIELAARAANAVATRIKNAEFPVEKDFDTYDFSVHAGPVQAEGPGAGAVRVDRTEVQLLPGRAATGRGRHISRSDLGLAACRAGLRVRFFTAAELVSQLEKEQKQYTLDRFLGQLDRAHLLICDELGYVTMSRGGVELLFRVFADRYERGSLLVTSNLPFSEWGQIFQGERMTAALLDRLSHHCHIFEMNGESYRFRESMKTKKGRKAE